MTPFWCHSAPPWHHPSIYMARDLLVFPSLVLLKYTWVLAEASCLWSWETFCKINTSSLSHTKCSLVPCQLGSLLSLNSSSLTPYKQVSWGDIPYSSTYTLKEYILCHYLWLAFGFEFNFSKLKHPPQQLWTLLVLGEWDLPLHLWPSVMMIQRTEYRVAFPSLYNILPHSVKFKLSRLCPWGVLNSPSIATIHPKIYNSTWASCSWLDVEYMLMLLMILILIILLDISQWQVDDRHKTKIVYNNRKINQI